ncbi:hypothetical protein [Bosea sp. (in: a-proteobacteria)]|uniref:hypothetical protein n=1 Tax=Bosea sp. (in: a-proteobacteria) TaxID=1871050 RepID=UPI0035637092
MIEEIEGSFRLFYRGQPKRSENVTPGSFGLGRQFPPLLDGRQRTGDLRQGRDAEEGDHLSLAAIMNRQGLGERALAGPNSLKVLGRGNSPRAFGVGFLNLSADRLRQIQNIARRSNDRHHSGERFSLIAERGLILLHLADPVDETGLLLQHGPEFGDGCEDFANGRERRCCTALSQPTGQAGFDP